VLTRYLRGAVFARESVLTRLFGLRREEARAAVERLGRAGVLADRAVKGWPGRWLVHQDGLGHA
jgi:hypothetical protein